MTNRAFCSAEKIPLRDPSVAAHQLRIFAAQLDQLIDDFVFTWLRAGDRRNP